MSLLLKVEKNSGVNWLRKQTKAINVGKGTCSVSCLSLKNLVIKYFQILFSPSFQGSFRSLQDVGCYGTECVSKQTQRGGWHQKKFKMSKQLKIEIGFLVIEGKVSSSKVRFFVSFYMVGEHTQRAIILEHFHPETCPTTNWTHKTHLGGTNPFCQFSG